MARLSEAERRLERRATRILAKAAFKARAIGPTDFDFLDESPHRWTEVPEFADWLAGPRA